VLLRDALGVLVLAILCIAAFHEEAETEDAGRDKSSHVMSDTQITPTNVTSKP
jgi:hypothetical protein